MYLTHVTIDLFFMKSVCRKIFIITRNVRLLIENTPT